MARLKQAILGNDERLFATYGGVSQADVCYSVLGKLPAGTEDRGGSIDHFVTWTTGRLVGPEAGA